MPEPPDDEDAVTQERSTDLSKRKKVRDKLLALYKDVEEGFDSQWDRENDIQDYWEVFNCKLGSMQYYTGESHIFVPIVKNAVRARKTRFTNQVFPLSERFVECFSEDGTQPYARIALLEHYVRRAQLRSLLPALLVNGDVEGQYTVCVSWAKHSRHTVYKTEEMPGAGEDDDLTLDKIETIKEEEVKADHPEIEIIADADLMVLPATAASLQEALSCGGSVTILRRWGKKKVEAMVAADEITQAVADDILEDFSTDTVQRPDKQKAMVKAAGIKKDGRGKHLLVYETWSMVRVPGEEGKRLCRTYFGGPDRVMSCVRNPLWCDRLPILSCPVDKVEGAFKGRAPLADVVGMQYYANDIINEAADSSMRAMLPIIMTDPEKNPRVGSMVLNMAAVWETSPKDTQFAKFPPLWQDGLQIVTTIKGEIFETLAVNSSMITQSAQKKQGAKRSQAEVAQEQQVDLLSTADAVTVVEEGILTPLLTLFLEMDHQYRDKALSVQSYGEMGRQANMEEIEPLQMDKRYEVRWFGVEAARSAQQVQAMISGMNMLRGIPPQLLPGYKINMAPLVVDLAGKLFGARLGPLVVEDIRSQLEFDPHEEAQLAEQGIETPVYPHDNQKAHMKLLMEALKQGDPHGTIRAQLMKRQMAMVAQLQQQMPAPPKGQPGSPGGAGPGIAGLPRAGAMPGAPRGGQAPPGAIHQDQMHDPSMMPRKM